MDVLGLGYDAGGWAGWLAGVAEGLVVHKRHIHFGCGPRPDSIDGSVLPLPYEAVFSAVQELCAIPLAVWESIGNRWQSGLVVYVMDWVSEGQPQLKQYLNNWFLLLPGPDDALH